MQEIIKCNPFTEEVPQVVPEIQTIKKQLTQTYEGAPWYGHSIKEVLELVDPDYVFDSPGKGMQSIGEIVTHMLSCRTFTEQRLKGDTDYKFQQKEFDWRDLSTNKKEAWNLLMDRFQSSQEKLMQLMKRHDDILFEKKVQSKAYTFRNMLAGILYHDIHHLGQIEYLQTLFSKKKEPQAGILKYSFRVFPFESLVQQK